MKKKLNISKVKPLIILAAMLIKFLGYSQCPPAGNQSSYGINSWIGYVYDNSSQGIFNPNFQFQSARYKGYINRPAVFSQELGTGSITGPNLCGSYSNRFAIRLKMRMNFAPGTYTFIVGGDDGFRLSLDGGATFVINSWTDKTTTSFQTFETYMAGNHNLVLEYYERNNNSTLLFNYLTEISSISANLPFCSNTDSSIQAISAGGDSETTFYQWSYSSLFWPLLPNSTNTINLSLNTSTTIYVRKRNIIFSPASGGTFLMISDPVALHIDVIDNDNFGFLTTSNNIQNCDNLIPNDIILNDNIGPVIKWQIANDSDFSQDVIDITSNDNILSGEQIGSLTQNKYIRAVVDHLNCGIKFTVPVEIIVPTTIVYDGSWSGTPTINTPVKIEQSLSIDQDYEFCSCLVSNGAIVTVEDSKTLKVKGNLVIENDSNLSFENNASLLQVNEDAVNSGNITYKIKTTPMKNLDYTYWSSPLNNQILSTLSSPSIYYKYNPITANWISQNANTVMSPGMGYIARAPNNLDYTNPQIIEAIFNGVPHNGTINVPFSKGTGTYNLIGNPYPSALDIDKFLIENQNLTNGTIYLWTHNTAISNTIPGDNAYNYTSNDYNKYNLTGGVVTALPAISGGAIPNGKVASGQGFFIEANESLSPGDYTVEFNNEMRLSGENSQFFRTNSNSTNSTNVTFSDSTIEKNRVWISMSNELGAFSQILVGYITNATNGFDNLFDGKTITSSNPIELYSLIEEKKLAIQGRELPFNINDTIHLGYKSNINSNFKISLDLFDGFFDQQSIYLSDLLLNQVVNLKTQDYIFDTSSGIFENRFVITFSEQPLNTIDVGSPINDVLIIEKDGFTEILSIKNELENVIMFDLSGREILRKNKINDKKVIINNHFAKNNIYLFTVTLSDGNEYKIKYKL